ncbi:MAG: ATP-grasp domain-containing protein [Firmicutes bacterium]|nr:ATP-grasp domain-containing protein [Bacillota bacterium]
MRCVNVLITGIGSAGVGEQILKSLNLSELNLNLVGTDVTINCFNKDSVDCFEILPYAHEETFINEVKNIVQKHNIQIIFPGSDPEMKVLCSHKSDFENIYIVANDLSLINTCLNKNSTYELLKEALIPLPKYMKINLIIDCRKIDFFPVVLKPNTGSGGSSHIYVAYNYEELLFFTQYMLNRNIDIIAQEYIEYDDNEYTIGVSNDLDGLSLGTIILKRSLTSAISVNKKMRFENTNVIISSGISQGVFLHDDHLKIQAERIATILKSKGPLNIQGRVSNGQLMLMEINPRLSGTTFLRALVGYNEPENIIKRVVFNELPEYEYEDGMVLRSLIEKRI